MQLFGKRYGVLAASAGAILLAGVFVYAQHEEGPQQPWSKFKVHQWDRPAPPIVTPVMPPQQQPAKPPSDAIVLFDGKDLSKWQAKGGGPPTFTLENGVMLSKGPKDCQTKEKFGDIQLHVEWAEPTPAQGESQGRGNSGVFLNGMFEIQVLDNYQNPTYPDGQCGAIYGQYPPQVNACLPPGTWQNYDIVFRHPRVQNGKVIHPAYVTVFQNGVLVQDHQKIEGPTGHKIVAEYPDGLPDHGPVELQFHGNPIHYRNIWVRKLHDLDVLQHTGRMPTDTGAAAEGK